MRVLLIATNRHDRLMSALEARPLPIGLAYVAGQVDLSRHAIKVLDLMFSADYLGDTERTVAEYRPELIGLSIRNLDNQSYLDPQWALPLAREVVQRIRAISQAPVVCGGPAFSILPHECLRFLGADLGMAGDAAETFAQLADRMDGGEPYHDLPGLVYREGEEIVVQTHGPPSTTPRTPRLEELDMARYQQAGFGVGILTKRDDFYSPMAADGAELEAAAWRAVRPIGEVIDEVQGMKHRFGLGKVFFIDTGFNIPLPHAKSLCRSLIEAELGVRWNTFIAPVPQAYDEESVRLMKEAGCSLALMGGSGGDGDPMLDLDGRLGPLQEACRLCEEGDLEYAVSQCFGEPGETAETVERKLTFLSNLRPTMASLRVGVRVLPGTPVAQAALRDGLITDDAQLLRPTFYLADTVRHWIVDRLKVEAERHPTWNLI